MEGVRNKPAKKNEGEGSAMKWVKASEFKVDCARAAEEANAGEVVLVIKSGNVRGVFAQAKPKQRAFFGMHKGTIEILGDIVSPMPELWGEDFK